MNTDWNVCPSSAPTHVFCFLKLYKINNFLTPIKRSITNIYTNDNGTPIRQYGDEPDDNDAHARRDLTQEHHYSVLQNLLQKYVGDRVGQGVFQDIFEQFNFSCFKIGHVWMSAQ